MFGIEIEKLYWLNGEADDPKDLCLHGQVRVFIGTEVLEYDPTVSAAALYLLRSVYEDHLIGEEECLLPCCGFSMFEGKAADMVAIVGCPNGMDWSVIHEGDSVLLETKEGARERVPLAAYKQQVFAFADTVKAYYEKCAPKEPFDDVATKGYAAFWREWEKLRNAI